MKANHYLGLLVSIVLLSACSEIGSSTPSEDKIKADLIGGTVCSWGFNTIKEFRKLEIVDQVTSSEIAEYDLKIEVEAGEKDSIMDARAIYKKSGGDWVLSSFKEDNCTSTKEMAEQKQLMEEGKKRYTDHGDGTITDKQTGLMWKQCTEGLDGPDCTLGETIKLTWHRAIDHGRSTEFAGYNNWRLPNKNELMTLVNKIFSPTIHPSLFPNSPTPKSSFWSSTTTASKSAFQVNFDVGDFGNRKKLTNRYMRLVRHTK